MMHYQKQFYPQECEKVLTADEGKTFGLTVGGVCGKEVTYHV